MGRMEAALTEARLLAARQGSPLLGYLIEMALVQCMDEEAARAQHEQLPGAPPQEMDDRTRGAP